MKKLLAVLALVLAWGAQSQAQEKAPLKLVETVSFASVQRHWDHMGADLKSNRLFVTSGEDAVIEVLDLRTNKKIQTITGLKGPHNVLPFPEMNKIFVTDGEASELKIYNYKTLELMGQTPLSIDADPIVYDAATKYFYIVNGGREAKTPYCLISVVDAVSGKKLEDIKLDTNRLESMALEKCSQRLFVNMTTANVIGVLDRQKRTLITTWPITAGLENVPMQYDESTHRLFVVTRKPSRLVVVNTDTGKEVTSLPTADSVDDLAYDPYFTGCMPRAELGRSSRCDYGGPAEGRGPLRGDCEHSYSTCAPGIAVSFPNSTNTMSVLLAERSPEGCGNHGV